MDKDEKKRLDDIIALINHMADKTNAAGLSKLEAEFDGIRVTLEKNIHASALPMTIQTDSVPAAAASASTPMSAVEAHYDGDAVRSPIVGTYYAAPAPDAPNFVETGARVKKGDVLFIVEAMKLMNEIECERDGVVTAILVQNGQLVEFGQEILVIKP